MKEEMGNCVVLLLLISTIVVVTSSTVTISEGAGPKSNSGPGKVNGTISSSSSIPAQEKKSGVRALGRQGRDYAGPGGGSGYGAPAFGNGGGGAGSGSYGSGNGGYSSAQYAIPPIVLETLEDIMSQIPTDLSSLRWRDVDQCMDKFVCDTGVMVSTHAPSLSSPATWLLQRIWPKELQPKVDTFRRVANLPRHKTHALCSTHFKCKIKKLENLFHNLVIENSGKLKARLEKKLRPDELSSPLSVIKALFT